jgi:hypothetical protein
MPSEQEFWHWFAAHEQELFFFDPSDAPARESLFDKVAAALHKVNPGLTFEFGPPQQRREFVISAAGVKSNFPAVVSLSNSAPKLDRWQFTAFRPRRWPLHVIELNGERVDPAEVQFSLLDNGKVTGICLFIPGFRAENVDSKQIGYLLLDEALGEFDVETWVGLIKMLSPDAQTVGDRYPFTKLPEFFDRLVARLRSL